jgi:type II secretory pathway pseudopilin PulG
MMKPAPIRRGHPPAEDGYILVVVIFMLAILVLGMAIAAPKVLRAIQRDREVETMHRGKQYIRAIRLYYHRFGTYPPSVDALVNTNQIRFLRKRYTDPITGKDDWKPILFGQNKAPLALGFFGQPLGLAGPGLAGANPLGGALGSSVGAGSLSGSNSAGTPADASSAAGAAGGTSSAADSSSSSGTGLSGQTFGGGPIIGFSPASPKQSILVYKTKNHYNEWEFVYSPLTDMMTSANVPVAQPPPLQGGAPGAAPSPAPPSPAPTPTPPPAQ